MLTTITLIAAPGAAFLAECAQRCTQVLRESGYTEVTTAVLSIDEALDLNVNAAANLTALRAMVAETVAAYPVDSIVQASRNRRKRLLIADMESTIIQQEMLEEMAEVLGKRAEVAEITRRAMNGEVDFVAALQERVALFAGQPESLLQSMMARITPMPGAPALIAGMHRHAAQAWLVSGGFRIFTRHVAQQMGFDRDYANELLIENGKLTGTVSEPVLDKNTKLTVLRQGVHELGLEMRDAMVVGDGANDLPMITACTEGDGLGVAFRAKPSVQAQAVHKINHGDLTALLFAQGFKRAVRVPARSAATGA
ncbi:MAG: phosphoserine phosphatase SerB [Alphaproteobacteria bacterium]|nr:phosphoserine phosphatase SerB [Alphaproteobacteria bacterium]